MLGKLSRELRLLGADVEYRRNVGGMQAYHEARAQERLLLTRNKRLSKLPGTYFVNAQTAPEQVAEVREKYGSGTKAPEKEGAKEPKAGGESLSRCLECNEPLVKISREQARPGVPFFIYQIHHEFHRCPKCKRVYWPGDHAKNMQQRVHHRADGARQQRRTGGQVRRRRRPGGTTRQVRGGSGKKEPQSPPTGEQSPEQK